MYEFVYLYICVCVCVCVCVCAAHMRVRAREGKYVGVLGTCVGLCVGIAGSCADIHLRAPAYAGRPMATAGVQFCCFWPHLMHSSFVIGVIVVSGCMHFPIIYSSMSRWQLGISRKLALLWAYYALCFAQVLLVCIFDLPSGRAVHRGHFGN